MQGAHVQALDLSPGFSDLKGGNKSMKEEESSKCMYIRSTANILLKWKDMRSIADIPKLGDILLGDSAFINLFTYRKV